MPVSTACVRKNRDFLAFLTNCKRCYLCYRYIILYDLYPASAPSHPEVCSASPAGATALLYRRYYSRKRRVPKRKNPLSGKPERGRLLPLALASSFCFLLAFHAGLFIMLALASLCQNTCASTLTFEPLQSAFQGFVFADAYLGHCYPSPRSFRRGPFPQWDFLKGYTTTIQALYREECVPSTRKLRFSTSPRRYAIRSAIGWPPIMWK